MVDELAIGPLVAGALAAAGEAFVKGTISEGAKDVYRQLKSRVLPIIGNAGDVEALELNPESKPRQAVIAENIDARSNVEQSDLRRLAEHLVAKLKHGNTGLDISKLEALEIQLGAIMVSGEGGNTGARLGEVKATKSFTAGPITLEGQKKAT